MAVSAHDVAAAQHPDHVRGVAACHHRQLAHIADSHLVHGSAERLVTIHGHDRMTGHVAQCQPRFVVEHRNFEILEGGNSEWRPHAVEDQQRSIARFIQLFGCLRDRQLRQGSWNASRHCVGDRHRAHQVDVAPAAQIDSTSAQFAVCRSCRDSKLRTPAC